MSPTVCPSADSLREYLLGLDGDRFSAVETHLNSCPRCAAALDGLESADDLVVELGAVGTRRAPRNAILEELCGRLRALPSANPTLTSTASGSDVTAALPAAQLTSLPNPVAALTALPNAAGPPSLPNTLLPEDRPTLQHPPLEAGGPPPLPPPTRMTGRYQVLERLGEGGMGTVYRALDPHLNRAVAIKIPRFEGVRSNRLEAQQRFLREGRAAAAVRHSHVCPIFDVGEQDGVPYVVMAFVEGQSLAERLRENRRIEDVNEAVALARQIADGLAAVHAQNIIHRDLKPGNILIDRATGQVLLTDFGLARNERDSEHLTADGSILGTPAYMSPEQATQGGEAVGPASDQYSLAVVLYQMLTGRPPFVGDSVKVIYQIGAKTPPPASDFRPELDPKLVAILRKAMATKPEDRYPDVTAFAAALTAWLRSAARAAVRNGGAQAQRVIEPPSLPTTVPAAPPRFRTPAALRRRAVALAGLGAVMCAGLVLAVVLFRNSKRPANKDEDSQTDDTSGASWVPDRRRGSTEIATPQHANSPIRPNSAVMNPMRITGVHAWNIESDRKESPFTQLSWTAGGSKLLLRPLNAGWTSWDFKAGTRAPAPFEGAFDTLFPDGSMAVRLNGAALPEIWRNPTRPEKVTTLRGAPGITSCVPSPDGTYVAGFQSVGGGAYDLLIWDRLALVRPLKRATIQDPTATGNLWSNDSRSFLTFSPGGASLGRISPSEKEIVGTVSKVLPNPGWGLFRGSLSPDGTRFAGVVGGVETQCWVWDVDAESRSATITAVSANGPPPQWAPPRAEKLACILADEKTVGVFNPNTGALLKKIGGDGSKITALAFSRSGDTLVTCSEARSVRFWDPDSGALIGTILFLADGQWAAINPQGHYKCSDKGEDMLVFEVLKEEADGKIDRTRREFANDFPDWKNDPSRVRFIGP